MRPYEAGTSGHQDTSVVMHRASPQSFRFSAPATMPMLNHEETRTSMAIC
jgi:hypothetical protein